MGGDNDNFAAKASKEGWKCQVNRGRFHSACAPSRLLPCDGLAVILRGAKELGIADLLDAEDRAQFEKALQEAENSTKGGEGLGS